MYRLELIQASTLVWQPGMAKALPLSIVAGIDDEESDVMEIEPELIPEPVRPPTFVRQPTIAPPRVPAAPLPTALAPVAPSLPTPDFYSPESLRPITMTDTPSFRPERKGVFGRVLLGTAIAAGVLITLYRNDLLRPVVASAGSEAAYEKIEATFGSPGFGTTRSVASFSATLNPDPEPNSETAATSLAHTNSATRTSTDTESATQDTAASAGNSSAASRDSRTSTADKGSARSTPPARKNPVRRKSAAPSGKKLKSFTSSEYDPMNAKL
jgi:hypothetical protein